MKKRYFWIYVLPVLMMTTTLAFGVLGVQSAMNAVAMEQELEKLEWAMEPLSGETVKPDFYEVEADILFVSYNADGEDLKELYFSSDPIELSGDEMYERYYESESEEEEVVLKDDSAVRWQNYPEERKVILGEKSKVLKEYGEELFAYTGFSDGLSLLYFRDRLVCINEELDVVFEKEAKIKKKYAEHQSTESNSIIRGLNTAGFLDGLAVFTLDGCKYGIIDEEGNVVIEPVFKGKDALIVMKNHHVAFCYEDEFRIGEIDLQEGNLPEDVLQEEGDA